MRNGNKKWRWLLTVMVALILSACGEEVLYNNLSQTDANKVMVLLQQNGIEAKLEQERIQNEIFWVLKVQKENLARSRELIVTSNIISPRSPGLKEVYQSEGNGGWIKTPAEERARYILALKGEVINALTSLPEVIDADVVLNIPEKPKLGSREKKRPTASVVIKAAKPPLGESALSEITVQQWVANTVEELSPRDVSVLINYVAPIGTQLRPGQTVTLPKAEETPGAGATDSKAVRLMGLQLSPESRQRLKVYLILFFVVLILMSLALIVTIIQSRRTREELKALKGGEERAAIEGEVKEETPQLEAGEREEQE